MKKNLKYIILMILICNCRFLFAQSVNANAPAQISNISAFEIKKAQAAVETDPDNLAAHNAYIAAMGLNNPLLVSQYYAWMKKYPGNVNIPLTVGTAFYRAELPQAKEFLLKASEIEPKNAKIWFMLWGDADRWGQNNASTQYIKNATLADPSDVNYAFYYLTSSEKENPALYKQKVFDFVKRFPTNERGAQALYWLGENNSNLTDKIACFEDLRKLYPPKKFNWSSAGMIGLADAYLQTNPEKALSLIKEMGEEDDWKIRKQIAESLIQAEKSEQEQNYQGAIIEFNRIKLPKFNYINEYIVLKKCSLLYKCGNFKAAYDSVAVKFAKSPTDGLYNALELYGKKSGKYKGEIDKDIQIIRNNGATPAYPFDLGLYTNDGKLALKELKGKVVLLTFWFPGCGPCRAEFPHFQTVLDKINSKNVVYIGINVLPEQNSYVIPFMKNTKYSFIPLRGNRKFAQDYYAVQGEPENFLIDKAGKIVFKDFRIDETNHRTLELMITSML